MSSAEAAGQPALRAAVRLFNQGLYLASHELFEELWEGTEGPDADFYKGLIQAAVAMHHLQEGNLEGAAQLFRGHRTYLAPYLPTHHGLDLEGFLGAMQTTLRPLLRRRPGEVASFDEIHRPRLEFREEA